MAPVTAQWTSLEEDRGAYARSVMQTVLLDVTDQTASLHRACDCSRLPADFQAASALVEPSSWIWDDYAAAMSFDVVFDEGALPALKKLVSCRAKLGIGG
jgi:hypothetical protein